MLPTTVFKVPLNFHLLKCFFCFKLYDTFLTATSWYTITRKPFLQQFISLPCLLKYFNHKLPWLIPFLVLLNHNHLPWFQLLPLPHNFIQFTTLFHECKINSTYYNSVVFIFFRAKYFSQNLSTCKSLHIIQIQFRPNYWLINTPCISDTKSKGVRFCFWAALSSSQFNFLMN